MRRTRNNMLHVLDDKLYLRRHAYSTRIGVAIVRQWSPISDIDRICVLAHVLRISVNSFRIVGFLRQGAGTQGVTCGVCGVRGLNAAGSRRLRHTCWQGVRGGAPLARVGGVGEKLLHFL